MRALLRVLFSEKLVEVTSKSLQYASSCRLYMVNVARVSHSHIPHTSVLATTRVIYSESTLDGQRVEVWSPMGEFVWGVATWMLFSQTLSCY